MVQALERRRCVQARGKHVAFSKLCNTAVLVPFKVFETLAIVQMVVIVRLHWAPVILSLPSDRWSGDQCVSSAEAGLELEYMREEHGEALKS